MSLSQLLSAAEPREDGFALAIPPDWLQGRTAYGGLSAALALAAARRAAGDLPPMRSAQVAFVGPLAGPVEARARVLRRGRNATWMTAELSGEGGVGLVATMVFMSPVASRVHVAGATAPAPLVPPDQALPVADRNQPVFLQNFEARYAVSRSTERKPEIAWWVRHRERDGLDPVLEVVSIADATPPGVLPLLDRPVNVSSMTWMINLLTPAPATRDGWWLLRTASDFAQDGCASDGLRLWNADGEPIARGMQSVAVFG